MSESKNVITKDEALTKDTELNLKGLPLKGTILSIKEKLTTLCSETHQ